MKPSCQVTYVLQIDAKVPYLPTSFISLISVSQPMNINALRDVINKKKSCAPASSEFNLEKLRNQDKKFVDLISIFDTDEECIAYLLNKFHLRNPESLANGIKEFQEHADKPKENHSPLSSFSLITSQDDRRGSSFSNNIRYGVFSSIGVRDVMEDQYTIETKWKDDNINFFGVYDGHYGALAAEFCKEHFCKVFFQKYEENSSKQHTLLKLMEDTFESIEQQFLQEALKRETEAGTCVSIVLLVGPKLIVANLGDSYSVLGRSGGKEVILSEIHNGHNKYLQTMGFSNFSSF